MIRILIADDHEIVRKGVRDVINEHPGWQVCAEAENGPQALELALREKPDIAVLDVSLPLLNGVALTRRLHQDCPSIRVLLFTMHDDDETVSTGLAVLNVALSMVLCLLGVWLGHSLGARLSQ